MTSPTIRPQHSTAHVAASARHSVIFSSTTGKNVHRHDTYNLPFCNYCPLSDRTLCLQRPTMTNQTHRYDVINTCLCATCQMHGLCYAHNGVSAIQTDVSESGPYRGGQMHERMSELCKLTRTIVGLTHHRG